MNLVDVGEFNGGRLYIGRRLDYRPKLRLLAPTSASRAIYVSAVAVFLILIRCRFPANPEQRQRCQSWRL